VRHVAARPAPRLPARDNPGQAADAGRARGVRRCRAVVIPQGYYQAAGIASCITTTATCPTLTHLEQPINDKPAGNTDSDETSHLE